MAAVAQRPLMPRPDKNIVDKAGLIADPNLSVMDNLIRQAFEKHDTPIVVCTINNMYEHAQRPIEIEEFAKRVFNEWEIGTLNRTSGVRANKGILVLVSVSDRKARIELGADWGLRWDAYCKSIMDSEMVPKFRQNQYSEGILRGVYSLEKMAELGPESAPPEPGLIERLQGMKNTPQLTPLSPIPGGYATLMLVAGVFFCALAILLPNHRKNLLYLGIGLIVAALFLWIIVGVIAIFTRGKVGGGFSGGLGGGGFSGGGGASGSW